MKPIKFDSARRVHSNKTSYDCNGYPRLHAKVSAFLSLLSWIAMPTLRNLYHLIALAKRNPTYVVPTQSNLQLIGYQYFCTLVPQASTVRLMATVCYRYVDALRPIPFNSPHQVDPNVYSPCLVPQLVLKPSPLLYFYYLDCHL